MMRSLIFFVVGVVVFVGGLQQFLQRRSHADSTSTPAVSAPIQATATSLATPTSRSVRITVDGLNFTFAPASITVQPGTTVVWESRTASPHTITSVTPHLFDVPIRGRGRAQITFRRSGTYQYYCALHPYMLGVVYVRAAAPTVSSP
jgi:plastocyanin